MKRQERWLGRVGWCAVAALLAGGALLARGAAPGPIDWQPGLALTEPWRWWSAAWVHFSPRHLSANLLGAALVAALGVATGVPRRAVVAWLAAWPLTHLALRLQPELAYYGGLSGVLHAGVAVVAVQLVLDGPRLRRLLGLGLLAGLAVKIALEAPWGAAVRYPPEWDIGVAPLAHATGAGMGVLLGLLLHRRGPRGEPAHAAGAPPGAG